MSGLFLPSLWVYVRYEDGKRENVANTDTLSQEEADTYKTRWETARKKKVVQVTLESLAGQRCAGPWKLAERF